LDQEGRGRADKNGRRISARRQDQRRQGGLVRQLGGENQRECREEEGNIESVES
jgi:hypothetical protein